jgi:hypothetical protein
MVTESGSGLERTELTDYTFDTRFGDLFKGVGDDPCAALWSGGGL